MLRMRPQLGASLVVIVLAVAILGIGAVFGVPAYRDYTIRARVSELILAGSSWKTAISEKFAFDKNATNAGEGLAGMPMGKIQTPGKVSRDGRIDIVGVAAQIGVDVTITLVPSFNTATGEVTWSCAGTPAMYMPAACR